jgi:hypothetical protein
MWPKIICDELRIKLVNLGPQQITDINFPKNDANNNRKFSASHYKQGDNVVNVVNLFRAQTVFIASATCCL